MSDFRGKYGKEIESLLKMSRQNLTDARILVGAGGYRSAISRAYYMFLDLAKAALLTKGIIVHSHAGAVAKFGEVFVKAGIIKGDYGRSFSRALEIRSEADYEALREFTKEDAEDVIKEAESFFNEVKTKISS
jgi:uncharacterized protein (UPF0332 family)